jgi:hypothetical protein
MNRMPPQKKGQLWLAVALAAALVVLLLFVKGHSQVSPARDARVNNGAGWTNQIVPPAVVPTAPAAPLNPNPAGTNSLKPALNGRSSLKNFSWFQARPFPVAESNALYQWTSEDGRDTNVILRLAHNDLEYARMVAENSTIFRRQLVYHPEGFSLLAQQAVQSGQSVAQLALPGLDGETVPVTVTRTDFESGGDRGLFYGKVAGRPDSMVTVAFIAGREAFTVISPQDRIFLQAEAREPGEIIVKSIDPKTYGGHAD